MSPAGPKTLCNACGVKRVRLLKKDRENAACKAKKAAAAAAKVSTAESLIMLTHCATSGAISVVVPPLDAPMK
jgi:hypothetical protein